jgi:hypothetical protein
MDPEMETLQDVLLYLARHVPAGPADLAVMERIIGEAFTAQPAPPAAEQPGT